MFYSQLLTLNDSFSKDILTRFDSYLSSLSLSAAKVITVDKVSNAITVNYDECMVLLKRCVEIGLMAKRYALCCPVCGGFLKTKDSLSELMEDEVEYCVRCEEKIDFEENNKISFIEVLFSLKKEDLPFVARQQLNEPSLDQKEDAAAATGNLKKAIKIRLVRYEDLFSPSQEDYMRLEQQVAEVKKRKSTTVEAGSALENLCKDLFGLCCIFKAGTKVRSEIHQTDTFVRYDAYVCDGLFGLKSNFFIVECKNERTTPKGEYMSKLHSNLRTMRGELGIIVSRMPAPVTYRNLAREFFLLDEMYFIWFDLKEIEILINNRVNLLEAMDNKILELRTDSKKTFYDINL